MPRWNGQSIGALEALTHGLPVDASWLAGFYLDSALMRLAALNERIDTYLGKKHDTAQQIRRLVNEIKHEVDAGIGQGWTIKF
jgi:hypothetical protein